MTRQHKRLTEPCKLFKLQGEKTPDFCGRQFEPKVDWQKFCSNDSKCHDEYWRLIYREKKVVNQRLERLEKTTGISAKK